MTDVTKTYAEVRQLAYFRAAVELYKLAIQVGEDVDPDDPNETDANRRWAESVIDSTFEKALDLEQLGHGEAVVTSRWETRLGRLRAATKTSSNRALKARIIEAFAP